MASPRIRKPLLEDDVAPDPVSQFEVWFRDAGAGGSGLPEAMTLATATKDGAPSARTVLLKAFDARGFVFYSNYESRKGQELGDNPQAALVFHWQELGRQVRVEGRVARIPRHESESYFLTRPLGSRLAAWASRQSEAVESRAALEARFAEVSAEYDGGVAPLPPFWGGFRLTPETVEFWQHRENRLHDRLRYRRHGNGWLVERLAP